MTAAVVAGGGIAGLVAARDLAEAGFEVTVHEASDRLGGKIRTEEAGGTPLEVGPDCFLARVPSGTDLCRELGLGDDLVAPATGQAWIWARGSLHPIPPGTVLGVPVDMAPIWRSTLLPLRARVRAALEPVWPGRPIAGDRSVADTVAPRYGRAVAELLVEPLLGGINAGRSDGLSVQTAAPQLHAAASSSRSIVRGLRRQRTLATAPAGAPGPVFWSLRGGLERLVDALAADLAARRVAVRTHTPAPPPDGATPTVVALPAFAAAPLLRDIAPGATAALETVDHASVAIVTCGFDASTTTVPAGSGILVPRVENRLLSACTFLSQKWPDTARAGEVTIRMSCGRRGDTRAFDVDDDTLVALLLDDLRDVACITAAPRWTRVDRWERAFPQYDVGHGALVAAVRAALPPHVWLAGAAYDGVGIASCIASGRAAARSVVASCGTRR